MKIVQERPPNFDAILKVFPNAANPGVIFAYGDIIYSPDRADLPPALISHEAVHGARQLEFGVELWWDAYLVDLGFRYQEELLAHRAEYEHLCLLSPSRNDRRFALKQVAKRLASPLYGKMVTLERAMKDIAG